MGPGNHVLDTGPGPPWEGVILRGETGICKIWGHSAVICVKTTESIVMLFGLWA